ncbi:MAG TPA: DegT/DnrJ/EryC1/StrS aminotransferase family protein, partial [Streptomyces sp.]|nr:DegT/DnrJ/EryC1/StrS aminotransferase family protein [Streptomyces sp.]
ALLRGQLGLRLARLDGDLDRRRAGVAALSRSAWSSPALRALTAHDGLVPLFRVPLLVHDRDALVERLVGHGVVTGYVYDPPLDDYAGPEFTDPSPDPSAARWFASHVLPADPLLARRIVHALTRERAAPARPPLAEPLRDTAPPAPLGQ